MRASNGKWYVRFVVDGVEYSQATGLEATKRNKQKAQQLEAAARRLVLEGKANLLRLAAIPFSAAAKQFLDWAEGEYGGDSRKTYLRIRSSFSYAQLFFGRAIVSAITTGHIEDFKSARRKMAIKEISLRHDLHTLSLFWQYAVRKNWARENILRNVDIPSGKDAVRMNVLSPEQEALYFETCLWMDKAAQFIPSPERTGYRDLYDFMRLMIQQGTRPEELLELRKADVDLTRLNVVIVVALTAGKLSSFLIVAAWLSTSFRRRSISAFMSTPGSYHLAQESLPDFCRVPPGKQANER
jgi:integrase